MFHLLATSRSTSLLLLKRFTDMSGQFTHISPSDLSINFRWHVPTAVLLLELSLAGGQPLLQGGALFLELLRQRQSFFQILLALCYL